MTYRLCVGAVIVNSEGKIFLGQRLDNPLAWQMPQGGIDEGELPSQALLREVAEEIGVKDITILKEAKEWYTYDLPLALQKKVKKYWGNGVKGQRQKWFLCTIGANTINLQTHHPEFGDYKWATAAEVMDACIEFKKVVYEAVLKEFINTR